MTQVPELTAAYLPLVRRIEAEATVVDGQTLRIDHFLNHRIEPVFIMELGRELARRLSGYHPTLVLTAEASGIAPAMAVAQVLNLPLLFAKKYDPRVELPALSRIIPSPTKGGKTKLVLSRRYVPQDSRIVIVDDFLSNGRTALALVEMAREAGAEVLGAGFIIDKRFRKGHELLERAGVPIAALARVEKLENGRAYLSHQRT